MTITQHQLNHQHYINWIIGEHEKLQGEDYFEFAGQQFVVKPTVFNPNIATSSKLFAEEILKLDLYGKRVIDAGCGSGILSIAALKAGADFVYAFDINPAAVETTRGNLNRLGLPSSYFQVEQRDSLPEMPNAFDYIFFNPPFFNMPVDAIWKRSVCDPQQTFFLQVISNAKRVIKPGGMVYMVTSAELNLNAVEVSLKKNSLLNIGSQFLTTNSLLNIRLVKAILVKK